MGDDQDDNMSTSLVTISDEDSDLPTADATVEVEETQTIHGSAPVY